MQRFTLESIYYEKPPPEIKYVLFNDPKATLKRLCQTLHLSEEGFVSPLRERSYIDGRSMLTALFRYHSKTQPSYEEIARTMNRTHATAINSLKRHAEKMSTVNRRGNAMHPRYVKTYNKLRNDLCYVHDPSLDKKVIYGEELRKAIQPQEVPFDDWKFVMNLKFDLIELKNIIDQHPLFNEHQ